MSSVEAEAVVLSFVCLVLPVGMVFGIDGLLRGRRSTQGIAGRAATP